MREVNLLLDSVNITFSVVLIIEYIYSTYDPAPFANEIWGSMNTLIHIYFLLEWMVKLYSAKSLFDYSLSQESLIQLFSIMPYFILRLSVSSLFDEITHPVIQFSNMLSLLRVLEFDRCRIYLDSEVNK